MYACAWFFFNNLIINYFLWTFRKKKDIMMLILELHKAIKRVVSHYEGSGNEESIFQLLKMVHAAASKAILSSLHIHAQPLYFTVSRERVVWWNTVMVDTFEQLSKQLLDTCKKYDSFNKLKEGFLFALSCSIKLLF